MTVVERLISLVAEPQCVSCAMLTRAGEPFCRDCQEELDGSAPLYGAVGGVPWMAAGPHDGPLGAGIRRFKYGNRPELSKSLASFAMRRFGDVSVHRGDALLVPVPLHERRLAARGYNQSALLARRLGRSWNLRTAPLALRRTRNTPPQALAGGDERSQNVDGAFRSRRSPFAVRVWLIDDVLTTGATALACIHALREAGAAVDRVVTISGAGPAYTALPQKRAVLI